MKQPIINPAKNENPVTFPNLEVSAAKYILSGPGLIANAKHEKIKEITMSSS